MNYKLTLISIDQVLLAIDVSSLQIFREETAHDDKNFLYHSNPSVCIHNPKQMLAEILHPNRFTLEKTNSVAIDNS